MNVLGKIARLENSTLADRAYVRLSELLTSGDLSPGERISLRSVAEAFGVSIMPIRDAVTRLVADGALEVEPNRAIRVPRLTAVRFQELTRVRVMIEGMAAAQAALLRSDEDLQAMHTLEQAFRRQGEKKHPDVAAAVRANKEFHFAVYRAAGLPLLVDVIRGLWLMAGPIISVDSRNNPDHITIGGAKRHVVVLEAVERRDPEGARAALAADIESTCNIILADPVVRSRILAED
jgi:DNA-binding GntR family transcriptional regulator